MQRHGSSDAWDYFHRSLGRYVSAAGHAEWAMFVLLRELQRISSLGVSANSPTWAGLVRALGALPPSPFSERVHQLMRGAERRGRLRNNFVHASWFQASDDGYVARRPFAQKDQQSATLLMSREVLDNDVEMMEAFACKVDGLASEAQLFRP